MENFNLNSLLRENIKRMMPYSSARDEFKDASADMILKIVTQTKNCNCQ